MARSDRVRKTLSIRKHRMRSDSGLEDAENGNRVMQGSVAAGRAEAEECWVPAEGNAQVAGRDIGGMVYVGRAPRTRPGGYPDNAFIDPELEVSRYGRDLDGIGLHYWPSYSTIDPRSRATYLDWLAGGRADTGCDIGYVFLYFYGLERRVFVDDTDGVERNGIIAEVRRLLDVYGDNRSIRRYLGAFIEAASLLDPEGDPKPVFTRDGHELPTGVLVGLGRKAARREPLDADWLLSWYVCNPDTKLRTPARRAFREFKEYFRHLFDSEHPEGYRLRVPRRLLRLNYHASSGGFKADLGRHMDDVPDVTSLKNPLSVAGDIANRASNGLARYSSFLGRNPDGRGTLEAHALLPEGIAPLFPCPEKENLQEWIADRVGAGGMTPVEDVLEQLEGSRPERFGRRHLTEMAIRLDRLGFGVAPDPRFALRLPKAGEPVLLYHLPEEMFPIENPSDSYRGSVLKIAVGSLIANSDGRIDPGEQAHLAAHIDENRSLTGAERVCLQANLSWMVTVPPDLNMLRNSFHDTPESVRRELGRLAVSTACVDGNISREEIRAVEALYSALGLSRDLTYTDLHALTASPEPVTVRVGDPDTVAYAIPGPPEGGADGSLTLDAKRISSVMDDTVRVSQVLGSIFEDEDDREEGGGDSGATDRFDGLDAAHQAVMSVLITRQEWTEDEVAALANEHRLMVAGAIETINEWAYDKFDDALVEHYGDYEVNGELVHLLMH